MWGPREWCGIKVCHTLSLISWSGCEFWTMQPEFLLKYINFGADIFPKEIQVLFQDMLSNHRCTFARESLSLLHCKTNFQQFL